MPTNLAALASLANSIKNGTSRLFLSGADFSGVDSGAPYGAEANRNDSQLGIRMTQEIPVGMMMAPDSDLS
jgi:hypothetical protein